MTVAPVISGVSVAGVAAIGSFELVITVLRCCWNLEFEQIIATLGCQCNSIGQQIKHA